MSLHGNTYQVEAILVGRKVELVFCPFDLERIEVHHRGVHYGRAVPFRITRHAHPRARPETPDPQPPPPTGIAYLQLVADAHQQQIADDERIGYHALYATTAETAADADGPLAGQLSIDDALADTAASGEQAGGAR